MAKTTEKSRLDELLEKYGDYAILVADIVSFTEEEYKSIGDDEEEYAKWDTMGASYLVCDYDDYVMVVGGVGDMLDTIESTLVEKSDVMDSYGFDEEDIELCRASLVGGYNTDATMLELCVDLGAALEKSGDSGEPRYEVEHGPIIVLLNYVEGFPSVYVFDDEGCVEDEDDFPTVGDVRALVEYYKSNNNVAKDE